MELEIITREEALEQGLTHYFTSIPCKRGHISKRYVRGRTCIACDKIIQVSKQVKQNSKDRKLRNKDKIKKQSREYYLANKDILLKRSKNWRINNLDKARQACRAWDKNNKSKRLALNNKRIAKKLQATPKWLTTDQHKEIEAFYIESQTKKTAHHVDHIVPLRGKTVCGLHVPWNLRVIPALVNLQKSNTSWPDDWN